MTDDDEYDSWEEHECGSIIANCTCDGHSHAPWTDGCDEDGCTCQGTEEGC